MSVVPQARPSPMVEKFLATLHARGISGHCPFCQKNSWIILENPASIPVYEASMQLRMPGTNMPMATMICNNCGWSGFFSLGALGLLRPQTAPPAGGAGGQPAAAASTSPGSQSASVQVAQTPGANVGSPGAAPQPMPGAE